MNVLDCSAAKAIYRELERCDCADKRGLSPFFFKMAGQKVMLITLCPTFQAAYRPLSSIRFFRTIFLALFGNCPDMDDFTAEFQRSIYWTHYHKCYFPAYFTSGGDYRLLPAHCGKKYLDREIAALQPDLIILLGPVAKLLAGVDVPPGEVIKGWMASIPIIGAEFPRTGAEPQYQIIRKALKPLIPAVDTAAVPAAVKSDSGSRDRGLAVHAKFELEALKRYWEKIKHGNNGIDCAEANLDRRWYDLELIPRWERYSYIITCCAFMEDQIESISADVEDRSFLDNQKMLERKVKALAGIKNKDHLAGSKLIDGIRTVRKVRNKIAHEGGRVDGELERIADRTPGLHIEHRRGMLRVDDEFCEYALEVVKWFVNFLNGLD